MIQTVGAMAFETPNPDASEVDLAVNDLGPLAWVLDELRKSLDAATKAIKRFVRDADAARGSDLATIDTSALRIARQQVHSSVGALDMVGLNGPAAVLRAMELAVQKFVQQPEKCNEEAALKVERASFALIQYLEAIVAGKSLSAVSLFPQFKPVQEMLGVERIHPADLWEFDFREMQPKFELQAAAMLPSVGLRSELDKCVLQIVKSNDMQAALTLRDRFSSLHAGGDDSVKTLWAVTAALFEALGQGLLPADLYVKRMPSRILGQYNMIAKGESASTDVLLRDLLFFCAQAAPKNVADCPILTAVRAGYRLSRFRPVDYVVGQFGSFDPAVLSQARKRISGAKDLWSTLAGGETSKAKATADQFSLVADSLVKLHPASQALADALMRAIEPSTSSARAPSAELAMEVATAVLYLEAAFEDLDPNDPELVSRTQRLAHRLESVRAGGANEPLERWIEELYRRVSDRQTMGSVVGELRVSLSELERSLDQFFRDPTNKQVLRPVPDQLAQMRGVLTVLGLSDASQAVIRMRSVIEEMLVTGIDPQRAREAGTFDKLGNNLGALGFLIDMLGYQPAFAKKLFTYDAVTGELRPLMGRSEPRVLASDAMSFGPDIVVKVAAPESASAPVINAGASGGGHVSISPAVLAASAALASQAGKLNAPSHLAPAAGVAASPPPADDFGDDDIREIFLEEAREVVQTGGEALDALEGDPSNLADQTTLRRAFHTLKGSSRMVGLNEFGEAGWAMEQVFNAWLAEQKPVSADLMKLSRNAMAHFGQWVEAIEANAEAGFSSAPVRASADAMRVSNQLLAIPAVARVAPPVAVFEAPLPVSVSVEAQASPAEQPPKLESESLDWMFEAEAQVEPVVDVPVAFNAPIEPTVAFQAETLAFQVEPNVSFQSEQTVAIASSIAPVLAPMDAAQAPLDDSRAPNFEPLRDFSSSEIASLEDFELPAIEPVSLDLDADFDFDLDSVKPTVNAPRAEFTATNFGDPELELGEAAAFDEAMLEDFVLDLEPAAAPPIVAEIPVAPIHFSGELKATEPIPGHDSPVDSGEMDLDDFVLLASPETHEAEPPSAATVESSTPELSVPMFGAAVAAVGTVTAVTAAFDGAASGAVSAIDPAVGEIHATSLPSADIEIDLDDFVLEDFSAPVLATREQDVAIVNASVAPSELPSVEPTSALIAEQAVAVESVLVSVPAPVVVAAAQFAPPTSAFAEPFDDQIKVIGPLRISIPLYNVYLTEADEWSRKLLDEVSFWQIDSESPISDSIVTWAHSLGGSSATVGFVALSDVARAFEHALQRGQRAGIEEVHGYSILFVDAANEVRRLLHQFAAGFLKEPRADLIERLKAFEPTTELATSSARGALDVDFADELTDSTFTDSAMGALEAFELTDEPTAPPAASEAVVAVLPTTEASPETNWTATADPRVQASWIDVSDAVELPIAPITAEPEPLAIVPEAAAQPTFDSGGVVSSSVAAVAGLVALSALTVSTKAKAESTIDIAPPDDDPLMFDVIEPVAVVASAPVPTHVSVVPPAASPIIAQAFLAPVVLVEPAPSTPNQPPDIASSHAPVVVQDIDDDIDAVDAVDADLFPIFEEEALELMPTLSGALRQWQARNDNMSAKNEVLRALHTLKGSARLAGALRVGEMSHRMESDIERFQSPTAADIEPLLGQFDAMQHALDALRNRDQKAYVEAVTPAITATMTPAVSAVVGAAALAPVVASAAFAPTRSTALPVIARSAASTQTVRVRSQLLDRMLNQTGEVMITRSRLEAELSQLRGSLGDLTNNLERMRQQLREIEVQAETQMQSRQQLAKTADVSFDPLEFDRFTRFQEITRSMAESVNDVATVQRNIMRAVESTEDDLIAQARQTRELQRDLLKTRMVEFEGISERLYRVVRQAGKDTGKQVKLDIIGGSIELDRGVLDRMTPAFEHLLRNCVAHGIESAEVRAAAHKEGSGEIIITLHQEGNEVAVEFADNGAGLNIAKIRAKAIAQNLIGHDATVGDAEAAALIFMPGFTTADQVSELAGRGIGMDVVRSEVQALGGRVETRTTSGQGTTFKMVLPLTTAVTQVVMLRTGKLSIGVPSNVVEVVRRATAKELELAYNTGVYEFAGEAVPFYWSGALLQSSPRSTEHMGRSTPVVVFRSAQQRVAMHVDEVLGNQEVVVKNLGAQLSRLPGLAGMSVLASGAVVLIYNPVALASVYGDLARTLSADKAQPEVLEALAPQDAPIVSMDASDAAGQSGHGFSVPKPTRPKADVPLVMVVDDSITVRRVTQRLLAREGYRVVLAADGLQALEKLQDEIPAVVLSDIEMPRMDGFDLARNIRMDNDFFNIPIIMITSRIAEKHKEHAAELGVNHYLGKPYAEDELLSLVRRYCFDEQPA